MQDKTMMTNDIFRCQQLLQRSMLPILIATPPKKLLVRGAAFARSAAAPLLLLDELFEPTWPVAMVSILK